MTEAMLHEKLGTYLAIGSATVAIFLMTGGVTDPVNAPKLFILGGFSFAVLGVLLWGYVHQNLRVSIVEILVTAFILWSLLVSILSEAPFSQNIYGTYGRNTGFLTYFCFAIILVAASNIKDKKNLNRASMGFFVAAVVNIVYSIWVLIFGDFIGWNNNYGAILGTFGNPNFISSFLGLIFTAALCAFVGLKKTSRFYFLILIPIILWLLLRTDSIQGLVVSAIGFWLVLFFWIRSKFQSRVLVISYALTGPFFAGLGIVGALGTGPLRILLSQPTVALREQYWYAAWIVGKTHPLFGVGMDSFGDWYRRARGAQALINPGPDTVTNAAHNIFLDLFANGGYPLLAIYLAILLLALKSLIRVVLTQKAFDLTFVCIASLWICFHVQSLISINQIGLAIWGWLLSGLLISYEKNLDKEVERQLPDKQKKAGAKSGVFSPGIFAFLGLVIGSVVAVPPLNADMKWRALQSSGKVDLLEPALTESYLNPLNSLKLVQAVEILEKSKLPDLAIRYARLGAKFNPDFFSAWQMLYYSTYSTPDEKAKAKSEMVRLDPLNSKLKQLP